MWARPLSYEGLSNIHEEDDCIWLDEQAEYLEEDEETTGVMRKMIGAMAKIGNKSSIPSI